MSLIRLTAGWNISLKEGNVLFNDSLNTFVLWLYGVRHMVKNHSDSERGNPLPPHGLLFPISSKGFYMHHPIDRIAHTTAFVTPVVEHWLEREIAQWVHPMKDWSDDPSHHEQTLLPRSYISLPLFLYASSHRQGNTYHSLCYTSRGALAGTKNSSMGPPHEGSIQRPITPWANALTTELHLAPVIFICIIPQTG